MRWTILLALSLRVFSLAAQVPARVCVTDASGHPLAAVSLYRAPASSNLAEVIAATGPDGCASFLSSQAADHTPQEILAQIDGFAHNHVDEPASGQTARIVLRPDPIRQSITVTADRGLVQVDDFANSVATLSQQQLANAPGLALDDRLHQVAGFTLFRRTSSWTANPTTEGVSLRGLGSTAASRTLVVSDQVPQNDPFGGWIHWDEIPTLAIGSVSLLRGGAADLFGSSAIGGVIDIVPLAPGPLSPQTFISTGTTGGPLRLEHRASTAPDTFRLTADASGASENSATGDLLTVVESHVGLALGAFSALSTGGYIPTVPAARGSVDVASNVFAKSGRLELRSPTQRFRHLETAFLRGNLLDESRNNGTPLQTNGTRLWRYASGADFTGTRDTAALRLFGARETYRQSFSSINATRSSETLTRLQHVPTDEFGFTAQAARQYFQSGSLAAGVDLRDIRATDNEFAVAAGTTTSISARQREIGGFLDGIWQPSRTSVSGSIRVDSFRTFSARQILSSGPAITALPEIDEIVASPHAGVTRYLGRGVWLMANGFRAFRGPTMNELYRTGQVGSQTTLANNSLLAERATGFEVGGTFPVVPRFLNVHASYFWTEVNRPISAILLSQTPAPSLPAVTQTLQRQNLGQISSRGLMLETHSAPWHQLALALNYQFAFATVTAFNPTGLAATQPSLIGNQIPQVPRESVIGTADYVAEAGKHSIANFHLIASYTGQQFDDAANQYVLHPFARIDTSADRTLGHGFAIFASAQNLLNRSIDAGRTPVLTLAAPRLLQAGLRYNFNR